MQNPSQRGAGEWFLQNWAGVGRLGDFGVLGSEWAQGTHGKGAGGLFVFSETRKTIQKFLLER